MSRKKTPETTKLADALRALAPTVADELRAEKIERVANALDQTAAVIGALGDDERIKQFAAYRPALILYREISGTEYVG